MEWAQKRKIFYALAFAGLIILIAAYPVYTVISRPATCSDQKQNGTETGVDCGGGCTLSCLAEIKAPRVVWAKAFSLGGNYYDLGAYVENPNIKAGVKKAHYTFRIYDNGGQLVGEKKGETEIPPGSGFVLFGPNAVVTGNPDRVEVLFAPEDLTTWIKSSTDPSVVSTKNQSLKNVDTKPRFDAVLVNNDPVNSVRDLTLSAIIYNGNRNPVAISQTYVTTVSKGGEQDIFFTWPSRFATSSENFISEILVAPHTVFEQ